MHAGLSFSQHHLIVATTLLVARRLFDPLRMLALSFDTPQPGQNIKSLDRFPLNKLLPILFNRVGLDYAGPFILNMDPFINSHCSRHMSASSSHCCQSCSFGASIRFHYRHIHCCSPTIHCSQRETLLDVE